MRQMVAPAEALEIVLQHVQPLRAETVAHEAALGRTLARDVVSDVELPPFDNSAMDGYAVVAADTGGACEKQPRTLRLMETIAAGEMGRQAVTPGTCTKIMTGAPLPAGADAVIMREDTREEAGAVRFLSAAKAGQHIRRAGSDVARGECVMRRGTLVRAAEWGMLASLDQAGVEVFRQPRAGIVATGEEIIAMGTELREGQIRDSNSYTLDGLARATGAAVVVRCRVGDDPQTLRDKLRELAQSCDVVITSGGVSAGDYDPVRDVLQEIAAVHFWKIGMKPGKPVMFATLADGQGSGVPVFGLPGNPVSVMVSFEMFVRPALLRMQGRRATGRVRVEAAVDAAFNSPAGKVEYVRALVRPAAADGASWRAVVAGDQSSGRLSTMTRSNALLVVPAAVTRVDAGQRLPALMTDWPEIEPA